MMAIAKIANHRGSGHGRGLQVRKMLSVEFSGDNASSWVGWET